VLKKASSPADLACRSTWLAWSQTSLATASVLTAILGNSVDRETQNITAAAKNNGTELCSLPNPDEHWGKFRHVEKNATALFERTRRRKIAKQFSDGAGVSL
jgi:hypothetical protein